MKSVFQLFFLNFDFIVFLYFDNAKYTYMLPANNSNDFGVSITKTLNGFFKKGYDKRVRPNYGGPPVEIGITMFVISISTVSEVQMDFTSDFYFRQTWIDKRLKFSDISSIPELFVGAEVAERIWVPDTFFANEKSADFHYATTKNTFLRITPAGQILRSIRMTVTSSCPMELQYFPMDRQKCTVEIESYGYSMADIIYKWGSGPASVGIAQGLSLPQFQILGYQQKQSVMSLSTGNYSRLSCEIKFARSLGFYLIQIYIPASLIVVISWVSFWLHRNATPARVALGVTTVLTMTTLMSSTNSQLPKVSYIKSIDVYLGTCFVMVFASFLEYATVGYLGKRIAMRKSQIDHVYKMFEDKRKEVQNFTLNNLTKKHTPQSFGLSPRFQASNDLENFRCGLSLGHHPYRLDLKSSNSKSYNRQEFPVIVNYPSHSSNLLKTTPLTAYEHDNFPPKIKTYNQTNNYGRFQTSSMRFVAQNEKCNQPKGTMLKPLFSNPRDVLSRKSNKTKTMVSNFNTLDVENPRSFVNVTPSNVAHIGNSSAFEKKSFKMWNNSNKLLGMSPSDIDKYSRIIFPVCFICFNLMYWTVYLHISNEGQE